MFQLSLALLDIGGTGCTGTTGLLVSIKGTLAETSMRPWERVAKRKLSLSVQAQKLKKSRVKWLLLPRYKSSSSVLNTRSYLRWSFLCLYPSVEAAVRVFLGVFWDLSVVWVSVKSPAAKVITVLPVVTALGVKRAVAVNVQQNQDVLVKVVLTIMTVTWAKNVVWMFVQTQRSVIAITTRNARLEKTAAMDPVQRIPTARLTATKI